MLTTTRRGCSACTRAMIWPRHCSHSVYSRPRYGLMMRRSCIGQVTLASVSSRQCRCSATCWNAGFHMAACESPIRATVVGEAVSPARALALPDVAPRSHAAVDEHGRLVGGRTGKRRVQVRRNGAQAGGRRDRGARLREGLTNRRLLRADRGDARGGGYRNDVGPRGGRSMTHRHRYHVQQQHACARRGRAGGAGHGQAGLRRSAQRSGEPAGVFDQVQGDHGEAGGDDRRGQPGRQARRLTEQRRHQQQHRPVPQVPRVRHPADRPHRRPAQQPTGPQTAGDAAAADHQRGAQHGQQRRGAGVGGPGVQLRTGQQDQAQTAPTGDRRGQQRQPAPLLDRQGHQATGGQLPGPGGQREERPRRRRAGPQHGRRQRRRPDQPRTTAYGVARDAARTGPDAPEQPGRADDQHRPHQIELLLHAQRPVVLERRRQVSRVR